MPVEIRLSQVGSLEAFAAEVTKYIAAMTAFNKVKGAPRPVAHPLVEQAVARVQNARQADTYVADYILVDDTPPPSPPPTLLEKKQTLVRALRLAENEAKYQLLPEFKVRLAVVKFQQASMKPEADRSAEEKEDIASYLLVQAAWQKIERLSAQAESDIDDLTDADIDNWQLSTFG